MWHPYPASLEHPFLERAFAKPEPFELVFSGIRERREGADELVTRESA